MQYRGGVGSRPASDMDYGYGGRDEHTRTTYTRNPSFLEKVGNSVCAAVFGVVIVLGAFPLLYWNEGRAVKTATALDEGLKYVIHVDNPKQISRSEDNKLVHLSGYLETLETVTDPEYKMSIKAVKLKRKVETFQWVEHKSERKINEGGQTRIDTTYTNSREWRTGLVDSSHFDRPSGHQNPRSMMVSSRQFEADNVYVGAYVLSKGLVSHINHFKDLHLAEVPPKIDNDRRRNIHLRDGKLYHSIQPSNPQVGDTRIQFSYAGYCGKPDMGYGDSTMVSIVAKQDGSHLGEYSTESGYSLELLYNGRMSAKAIFEAEHSTNVALTWALRAGGWLMMFIGFLMMTSIFTVLVSWIPIVRDIVNLGVTLACIAMATSFSLIVIAIGWIRFRPLLALSLLAAAAVPFVISKFKGKPTTGKKVEN